MSSASAGDRGLASALLQKQLKGRKSLYCVRYSSLTFDFPANRWPLSCTALSLSLL